MNVCIIPARGGSKRIHQKNIKIFNGKPIIAYSIEAALNCNCFDKVIVSTDNREIADVSKEYGAEVPFTRPAELSDDQAGTLPVIKHAIEWFESHYDISLEYVCCIYATAPFVKIDTIAEAFIELQKSSMDYCISVASFPFPIQRAVKITKTRRLKMFSPEYFITRSQDLEKAYYDAGQFYWGKGEAFKRQVPFFSECSMAHVIPGYLVQDIDEPEDWMKAEFMYQSLKLGKVI